ncbi:SAP domain-containing protein [Streptomyces sp. NPDC006422]|uniref:SAP domain-containing protein n=1 Tax=unclassified Streptomyces TaxID=2593676 RepID=UPI0033A30234
MALWVCAGEAGCGTKYAVGLSRCPRCHGTDFYEDGDSMAKITRHGGASDATLPVSELREHPGLTVPARAVEGDEVTGDGTGEVLPPVADEEYAPGAVLLEEPEPAPGPEYEYLTVEQLKEHLAARGLPKSGKRDDLVQRLLDDDQALAEAVLDTEQP